MKITRLRLRASSPSSIRSMCRSRGADRHCRPQWLRQVEPAGGAALGDGRDLRARMRGARWTTSSSPAPSSGRRARSPKSRCCSTTPRVRAPAEFNERRPDRGAPPLRRGAGSSYRINGRTVRAKDVQSPVRRRLDRRDLPGPRPAGPDIRTHRRQAAEPPPHPRRSRRHRRPRRPAARGRAETQGGGRKPRPPRRNHGRGRAPGELAQATGQQGAQIPRPVGRDRRAGSPPRRRPLARRGGRDRRSAHGAGAAKTSERQAVSAVAAPRPRNWKPAPPSSRCAPRNPKPPAGWGRSSSSFARLEAERDAAREAVGRSNATSSAWCEDQARESVQRDDANVRADRAESQIDDLPPEDAEPQAKREADLSAEATPPMASLRDLRSRSGLRAAQPSPRPRRSSARRRDLRSSARRSACALQTADHLARAVGAGHGAGGGNRRRARQA